MKDVNSFIEKLKILCGEDFESLNKMLGHTKKNTQSRTNQNFWHSIKFCVKANPTSQEQGLRSKHELGFPLNCHTPAG